MATAQLMLVELGEAQAVDASGNERQDGRVGKSLPVGWVTLLFSDIEGSTALLRRLGALYDEVLADHFTILRSAIGAHAGTEVSTEGDALLAVFTDAADAMAACVDAQRTLAGHAWPPGGEVRVRMGLHTGEVRLSGGEYVGLAVHQAARIVQVAHGGQAVCSSATAAACEGRVPDAVALLDLGAWRVRDFDGPEHLFQVAGKGLALTFPGLRTLPAEAHNLPLSRTSFVGREQELAELAKLLADHRLVTVLGPGGAGKTRVAFELGRRLARQFDDGAIAVLLAPLDDPGLVVVRVADALGVRDEPGHPLQDTVVAALSRRRTLLILDNCEHLVDAVAPFVDTVLARAGGVTVLATSRRPLQIDGERLYRLRALEVPDPSVSLDDLGRVDSVRLFLQRARAADADLVLDERTAPAVTRICEHLEGLPLAIELAASRLRSMPVAKLAERLGDALASAGASSGTAEHRQRTVRATVDWSHRLLTAEEAIAFRRLAVFRGGCDLDAVEHVVGFEPIEPREVIDLLDALVCHSLVQLDPRADGRYRMLTVVRDIAAEHLAASGEEREVRQRHLSHYASLVAGGDRKLRGPDQVAWSAAVDREADNVRAALEWGLRGEGGREAGVRMVADLAPYWVRRGRAAEGLAWAREALLDVSGALRPELAIGAGQLAFAVGDFHSATAHYEDGVAVARALGDRAGEALAVHRLGTVAKERGDSDTAEARHEEALRIARSIGDRATEGAALGGLGIVASRRADHDSAITLFERAVAIAREVGDRGMEAVWIENLGIEDFYRGDYDAALPRHEQALAIAREIGDRVHEGIFVGNLGTLASAMGDDDDAIAYVEEALAIARETGDRATIGHWLGNLGPDLLEGGDHDAATAYLEEALAIAQEVGERFLEGAWLGSLGKVCSATGDYAGAQARFAEALAIAREIGDRTREHWWLGRLGEVARVHGDYDTAVARYEEALVLCREIGERAGEPGLLAGLGDVALARGDEEAIDLYQAAREAARGVGRAGASEYAVRLGELALARGDDAIARGWADDALLISPKFPGRAEGLLALVAARAGDPADACDHGSAALDQLPVSHEDRVATMITVAVALGSDAAVRLVAAVHASLERTGLVLAPLHQAWLDGAVERARQDLEASRFDNLWAEGSTMSLEAAAAATAEQLRATAGCDRQPS